MNSTETTTSADFDKSIKGIFRCFTDESKMQEDDKKITIKNYHILSPESTKFYKSKRVKAKTIILKWK